MKVGKEEIVGVLTALELYLERDHGAEAALWEAQLQHIEQVLGTDLSHERYVETCTAEGARLRVRPPNGLDAADARRALGEGTPRVMVGIRENALVVDPQNLQPGEEADIASALRRVLLHETHP